MSFTVKRNKKRSVSVNLNQINFDLKKFSENFNPAVLDFRGIEREEGGKSVLKVLKKIAEYSSQNLKMETESYLADTLDNSINLS